MGSSMRPPRPSKSVTATIASTVPFSPYVVEISDSSAPITPERRSSPAPKPQARKVRAVRLVASPGAISHRSGCTPSGSMEACTAGLGVADTWAVGAGAAGSTRTAAGGGR